MYVKHDVFNNFEYVLEQVIAWQVQLEFPTQETQGRMGTSIECSDLRDCLGERALVMTGRWFRKELLPIQKSLRGKLVPIPLIILSENSWFTNEILTTGYSLLKGNLRKRSLLKLFLVASLDLDGGQFRLKLNQYLHKLQCIRNLDKSYRDLKFCLVLFFASLS